MSFRVARKRVERIKRLSSKGYVCVRGIGKIAQLELNHEIESSDPREECLVTEKRLI